MNGQSSCKFTHTALPIEIYTVDLTLSVMRIPLLGQFGERWIKMIETDLKIPNIFFEKSDDKVQKMAP